MVPTRGVGVVPGPAPSTPRAAPAEAEDSPGPAAGAGRAAVLGSAESPAACSGTGAGPAGTPGGSLLLAGGRRAVRHHAGLPELRSRRVGGGSGVRCPEGRYPTCTRPNPLTSFCGWLLRHLALLDRTMFGLGAPRNSLSGVLLSSNAKTARCLPPACIDLVKDRGGLGRALHRPRPPLLSRLLQEASPSWNHDPRASDGRFWLSGHPSG